jgi:hypothetical protein
MHIKWELDDPTIALRIHSRTGGTRLQHIFKLSELRQRER